MCSYLGTGDLKIHDNGSKTSFGKLRRMINGITIEHNKLKRSSQLKDPLDFRLDLCYATRP